MSRVCQVTGKGPMVGNNVSHANNKTKRRFLPNLHTKRFEYEVDGNKHMVTLRVSNHGLRIIGKVGLLKALEKMALTKIRTRGKTV